MRLGKVILLLLPFLSLVFAPLVSNCQTIASPGVYTLQNDLFGGGGGGSGPYVDSCIFIGSPNVVLDCNGFHINNTGTPVASAAGILVAQSSGPNITIKNCPMIYNYSAGIYVSPGNREVTIDTVKTFNTTSGIVLDGVLSPPGDTIFNVSNVLILNSSNVGFDVSGITKLYANNITVVSDISVGSGISFSNINDSSLYDFEINWSGPNSNGLELINSINTTTIFNGFINKRGTGPAKGISVNGASGYSVVINNVKVYGTRIAFHASSASFAFFSPLNVSSSTFTQSNPSGIFVEFSDGILFSGNLIDNNPQAIYVESSDGIVFSGNIIDNNQEACVVVGSGLLTNVSFISTSFTSNTKGCELKDLVDTTVDVKFHNSYFSGNGYDIRVTDPAPGSVFLLNVSNSTFVSASGSLLMDLFDDADPNKNYSISSNGVSVPAPLPNYGPFTTITFLNKVVNITNLTPNVQIDFISLKWLDSEVTFPPYKEDRLLLYKYNSSGWYLLNNTPALAANRLSIANHNIGSSYAILAATFNVTSCPVINSPGVYKQINNLNGAPNPGAGSATSSCVYISSSDVVYDCNGYNISNAGVGGATAFALNSVGKNVSIKNCGNISYYDFGVYAYLSNGTTVFNNTFKHLLSGVVLDRSNYSTVSKNIFYNTSRVNSGFRGAVAAFYGRNAVISSNKLYQNVSTPAVGIVVLNNFNYSVVFNNTLLGFSPFSSLDGVFAISSLYSNISSNSLQNLDNAIFVSGNYTNITSNFINYTGSAMSVNGYYFNISNNTAVNGATLTSSGVYGSLFNSSVSNNKIDDYSYGLYLTSARFLDVLNVAINYSIYGVWFSFGANGGSNISLYNITLWTTTQPYNISFDYEDLSLAPNEDFAFFQNVASFPSPFQYPPYKGFETIPVLEKILSWRVLLGSPQPSWDKVLLRWYDSEIVGFNESRFLLYNFSGGAWTLLNDTPNTASNTLSTFSFNTVNTDANFVIAQYTNNVIACPNITAPGVYTQINNLTGAPYNVVGFGNVCVLINSNDVVYNCNNFNISRAGALGAPNTAGVYIAPGLNNVTVQNCGLIEDYDYGISVDPGLVKPTDITLINNVIENASLAGISFGGANSNISSNVVRHSNAGIVIGPSSDYVVLFDNVLYNLTVVGIDVSFSNNHHLFVRNNISLTNIAMNFVTSNNNTIVNSVFENVATGFSFSNSDNSLIKDTRVINSTIEALRFTAGSGNSNLTISNLTITSKQYNYNLSFDLFDSSMLVGEDYRLSEAAPITSTSYNGLALTQFNNKGLGVGIIAGSPDFDSFAVRWYDSELGAFNENRFALVNESIGLTMLNDTPDTTNNLLSLSSFTPTSSTLAIIELSSNVVACPLITSPGVYTQTVDLFDWQYNYPYPTKACVLINSSDVVYNCNNFDIRAVTNPGLETPAAIIVAQGLENITINNCNISAANPVYYLFGIYVDSANHTRIISSNVSNIDTGVELSGVYNSTLSSLNLSNVGGGLVVGVSNLVTLSSSFIHSPAGIGAQISNSNGTSLLSSTLWGVGIDASNVSLTSNLIVPSFPGGTAVYVDGGSGETVSLTSNNITGTAGLSAFFYTPYNITTLNNRFDLPVQISDDVEIRMRNDLFNGTNLSIGYTFFPPVSINLTNVLFSSGGPLANFSNISLYDSVVDTTYILGWAGPVKGTEPLGYRTFREKNLNITVTGPSNLVLDYFISHWTDTEALGYDETKFDLFVYDGIVPWFMLNNNPDTVNNRFINNSLTVPAGASGIVSILVGGACPPVISAPGVYSLFTDVQGATNPANEFGAGMRACIKIASDNVVLNCRGFSVRNNGTINAMGVAINASKNVTVANCSIADYDVYGVAVGPSTVYNNDTTIYNTTITNILGGMGLSADTFKNLTLYQLLITLPASATAGFDFSSGSYLTLYDSSVTGSPFGLQALDISNATLRNLSFDNLGVGASFTAVTPSSNISLTQSTFTNIANGPAIYFNNFDKVFLSSSTISSSPLATQPAVQLVALTNSIVRNLSYSGDKELLSLSNSNNVTVRDSRKTGAPSAGVGILTVSNSLLVTLFNNSLSGGDIYGISLSGTNNSVINRTTLASITGAASNAIQLSNSFGVQVLSNTLSSLTDKGIYLSSSNATLSQNTITSPSFAVDALNSNLNLSSNTLTAPRAVRVQGGSLNSTLNTLSPSVYALNAVGAALLNISLDTIANLPFALPYSLNDNVGAGEQLTLNYSLPTSLPTGYSLFNNRSLNLTFTGTIDQITLHWSDAELGGFDENTFELHLNATGALNLLNNSPDTTGNTLSNFSSSVSGIYAVLSAPPPPSDGGGGGTPPSMLQIDLVSTFCNEHLVRVTDGTSPVAGANVLVKTSSTVIASGSTDSDGLFTFSSCTTEPVTITASKPGYTSNSIPASLDCSCPSLDVSFATACDGNTIFVSAGGTPVSGADVSVSGAVSAGGTSDSDGQFAFEGCGGNVVVEVRHDLYGIYSNTYSLIDCSACEAAPECVSDADCPEGYACVEGSCVVEVECTTDADCGEGSVCVDNQCLEGCRDDGDCPEGFFCDLYTGLDYGLCKEKKEDVFELDCDDEVDLGDYITCNVTVNDEPCASCEVVVISPEGEEATVVTNEEGVARIKAEKAGDYRMTIKGAEDRTLVSQPPVSIAEERKGIRLIESAVAILLLLLLLIILFILWKRRKKRVEEEEES